MHSLTQSSAYRSDLLFILEDLQNLRDTYNESADAAARPMHRSAIINSLNYVDRFVREALDTNDTIKSVEAAVCADFGIKRALDKMDEYKIAHDKAVDIKTYQIHLERHIKAALTCAERHGALTRTA